MAQLTQEFITQRDKLKEELDYLKKINESLAGGLKSKAVTNRGYRMELASQLPSSLQYIQTEQEKTRDKRFLNDRIWQEILKKSNFTDAGKKYQSDLQKKLESFKTSEQQQVSQQRRQTIFAGARNLDPTPQQNKITTPATQQTRRRTVFSTNETPFASMQRENIFKKVLGA